jgi:hypothetical protein
MLILSYLQPVFAQFPRISNPDRIGVDFSLPAAAISPVEAFPALALSDKMMYFYFP